MTFIRQEALEIYDGLAFDNDDQRKDTDLVLQKLGEFCVNTTNEIYERYVFNKRDQGVRKSIDAYTASLRSLVKTCSYDALTDNLNRDHMVVGILDKVIRKKLLQESKLPFKAALIFVSQTSVRSVRRNQKLIRETPRVIRRVISCINRSTTSSVQGNMKRRRKNVQCGAKCVTNVAENITLL